MPLNPRTNVTLLRITGIAIPMGGHRKKFARLEVIISP